MPQRPKPPRTIFFDLVAQFGKGGKFSEANWPFRINLEPDCDLATLQARGGVALARIGQRTPQMVELGPMATKQILIDIPAESEEGGTSGKYPNCYAVIPPNGKICERTGLKHAQLYKLLTGNGAARAFVRVANLKLPGAAKGKTLFHVGDMLRYLDMLAAEQGSGTNRLAERG